MLRNSLPGPQFGRFAPVAHPGAVGIVDKNGEEQFAALTGANAVAHWAERERTFVVSYAVLPYYDYLHIAALKRLQIAALLSRR